MVISYLMIFNDLVISDLDKIWYKKDRNKVVYK